MVSTGSGTERWFSVGRSDSPQSAPAGAEAVAQAIGDRPDPKLLVVFASCAHDLEKLARGIAEHSGDAAVIGCTTAGEIAGGGPADAGVVVAALGGDGFEVQTAAAKGASARLREAGAAAARCISGLNGHEHQVLMLLTDGLAGDQQEIVRGAYSVVGADVPLVGGCAGDGLQMKRTFQLHDREVLTDAVVGAAIGADSPFGIGVRHGWSRVGSPITVTRSEGTVVHELDHQSALDFYLTRLEAPEEAWTEESAFTRFAQTHPLGLGGRRGESNVRFVSGADFEHRTIRCIAAVPQGATAWAMRGDHASVLEATSAARDEALDGLAGSEPLGMLAFDCIARRGVLGDDGVREEIAMMVPEGKSLPAAGFYTYGEIARRTGFSGFHNQTLVVMAVS